MFVVILMVKKFLKKSLSINLKRFLYILLLIISTSAFATHNRAGEITFTHLTGLSYGVTVTTYTKADSPADRPKLEIFWGDGASLDSIPRISDVLLGNNIRKNVYYATHSYPGASPGPYIIKLFFSAPNYHVLI